MAHRPLRVDATTGQVQLEGSDDDTEGSVAGSDEEAESESEDADQEEKRADGPQSKRSRFVVNQFFARRRLRKHAVAQGASTAPIEVNDAVLRSTASLDTTLSFAPLSFAKPRSATPADACPPPLSHASLTYVGPARENAGGTLVLVGGTDFSGTANSDVWLYHEATQVWERVRPNGSAAWPPPRCGHCAIALNDAPPTTGLEASPKRTVARVIESTGTDRSGPCVVITCGADHGGRGRYYNDVWAFSLRTRTWECLHDGAASNTGAQPPCPRWGAVAGAYDDRLVVFGGESEVYEALADLHVFVCAERCWKKLRRATAPLPSPRLHAAGCCVGEKLIVTGGIGPLGADRNDDHTWVLELRTLLWRRVSDANPSPYAALGPLACLGGHALMPFDDMVVLFGGIITRPGQSGESTPHAGVWLLDVPNESWSRIGETPGAVGPAKTWTASSGGASAATTWPSTRAFAAVCPRTLYSVSAGMDTSLTLEQLSASGIHLTDEKETQQYVDALHAAVRQQTSFAGLLRIRNGRPVLSHNSHCFVFGGVGGSIRRPGNDLFLANFEYAIRR
jgi:hypothetical protein